MGYTLAGSSANTNLPSGFPSRRLQKSIPGSQAYVGLLSRSVDGAGTLACTLKLWQPTADRSIDPHQLDGCLTESLDVLISSSAIRVVMIPRSQCSRLIYIEDECGEEAYHLNEILRVTSWTNRRSTACQGQQT